MTTFSFNHRSAGRLPQVEAGSPVLIPEGDVHAKLAGKRAVVVVFSSYPADPRPRRAAEALANEGMVVDVICIRETDEEQEHGTFNGVRVTRIPVKRRRGGKFSYICQYGYFFLLSFRKLTTRSFRHRYDLVHVHNMPDFLVFSGIVPRLLGARVILDLHDPMPELMMAIYGLKSRSTAVRVLKVLEKWSTRFADSVLTVNESFKRLFSERSCPAEKIAVIMNAPDEEIFKFRAALPEELTRRDPSSAFVIMYHGSLVERHGLDIAVEALARIRAEIPNVELRIYGRSTPFLERVLKSIEGSPLNSAVRYLGQKRLEEIVEAIRECDVGIIPNQRSVFTELNTPTRIFEYLSQGKPVIAPRSAGILEYFGENEINLFELGSAEDLAKMIGWIFSHAAESATIVERGQAVYRAHMWKQERARFIDVVANLLIEKSS